MLLRIRVSLVAFILFTILGCATKPQWLPNSAYHQASTGEERCDALRSWILPLNLRYSVTTRMGEIWNQMEKGFRDDQFSAIFGVPYFELNDAQKDIILEDIRRCPVSKDLYNAIYLPFETRKIYTQGNVYKRALQRIEYINSAGAIAEEQRLEKQEQQLAEYVANKNSEWKLNAAGTELHRTSSYTVYSYLQPKEQQKGCGSSRQIAEYSIVHQKDFDHKFTINYIDNLLFEYDYFAEGKSRCADIEGIRLYIYMEDTYFDPLGEVVTKSVSSHSRYTNSPFMMVSYYLTEDNAELSSYFDYFVSDFASVRYQHFGQYGEEIVSVNAAQAFIKRGRRFLAEIRKKAKADASCLKKISTKLHDVYEENGRYRNLMLVHCNQVERIGESEGHEKRRYRGVTAVSMFQGLISASHRVCKANTPNGASLIEEHTTLETQKGFLPVEREYLGVTGETYVDRAIIDQYYSSKARYNLYFLGAVIYGRHNPMAYVARYRQGIEKILEKSGCGGAEHKELQNKIAKFLRQS